MVINDSYSFHNNCNLNIEKKEIENHCQANTIVITISDKIHWWKLKLMTKILRIRNICIVTKYLSQDIYQQQNEKNQ